MERPKCAATKVTDFRQYHLSGDLDNTIKGLVDNRVSQFEMATMEELKQKLEEEKEQSRKMQEEAEVQRIQNELELEKLKQKQWCNTLDKLKEAREQAEHEHEKCMEEMEDIVHTRQEPGLNSSVEWLKTQLGQLNKEPTKEAHTGDTERQLRDRLERESAIAELKRQQADIATKLANLENPAHKASQEEEATNLIKQTLSQGGNDKDTQESLMQQLRFALSGKREEDPNKMLLRALVTQQNKTMGEGGTHMLKPNIVKGLGGSSMADWFANLNRQEEGESDFNRLAFLNDEEGQGKPVWEKSGILDRATANVWQKQVWPQQNLGEDWADGDVKFKQLRFEHLVAGETRTIETCTELAEILGRLRLLRRIAYLRLRGHEWNLLRKMYAAILTSIETKEYSWESNFDRFKTIIYRKAIIEHRGHTTDTRPSDQGGRKRFCRDYNIPEGCPKNSPHVVWFGTGPNAVKRTVYHYCAPCLIRDRQQREHPEGHPECPHKD